MWVFPVYDQRSVFFSVPLSIFEFKKKVTLISQNLSDVSSYPDCFQPGLVERLILEVLQYPYKTDSVPSAPEQLCCSEEDDGLIKQKDIRDDDICPICQEELLRKRLPVTHCRFILGPDWYIDWPITELKNAIIWNLYTYSVIINSNAKLMSHLSLKRKHFKVLQSRLTATHHQWLMPVSSF